MDAVQTALSWPLQSSVLQAKTVTVSLSLFFLKLNTDAQLGILCQLYFLDLRLSSLLSTGLFLAHLSPLISLHLCFLFLVVKFNAFIIMKCPNVENRKNYCISLENSCLYPCVGGFVFLMALLTQISLVVLLSFQLCLKKQVPCPVFVLCIHPYLAICRTGMLFYGFLKLNL